jgi:hypothetical protein
MWAGGSGFKARVDKSMRPYLKNKLKEKGLGDMAEMVEHLFSKCEDMSSIPSTKKKKKKRKEKGKEKIQNTHRKKKMGVLVSVHLLLKEVLTVKLKVSIFPLQLRIFLERYCGIMQILCFSSNLLTLASIGGACLYQSPLLF